MKDNVIGIKIKQVFGVEIETYNNLPLAVKSHLDNKINTLFLTRMWGLKKIKSPIEQLLFIELNSDAFHYMADNHEATLQVQETIEISNKTFIVDFLLEIKYRGKELKIVVEADGHDYHEKTKEQAQKDRERDRLLQQAGFNVLRFTGSEIVKNPFKCYMQVVDFIENQK